jgi:hypothetical protein
MKKLHRKSPLRTLAAELIEVKGGDTPVNPNPVVPPSDDLDARTHLIELG